MRKKYFLFIFICSLLVLLLLSAGSVKAVDYDCEHYIEFKRNSNNTVYRLCFNEDVYGVPVYLENIDSYYWAFYSVATGKTVMCSQYNNGVYKWGKEVSAYTIISEHFSDGDDTVTDSRGNIVLYKDESMTDTFFQVTRLLPEVVKEKGSMGMVMTQILAILPMILVLVVSFLGLRKGLSMLSKLLHQS